MISHVFNIILGILALLTAFSFGIIKSYVTKRKLVKFQIYYWNLLKIFSLYVDDTLKNKGRIGFWFWVFIFAFCGLLIFSLIELIVGFL